MADPASRDGLLGTRWFRIFLGRAPAETVSHWRRL